MRQARIFEHTKVTLVGIEASRKAMDIAGQVSAPPASSNRGEPGEHGSLLALCRQERGCCDIGKVAVGSEHAMCASTAGVDRTFRDLYMHGQIQNPGWQIGSTRLPTRS